jgi:hypothetical protein
MENGLQAIDRINQEEKERVRKETKSSLKAALTDWVFEAFRISKKEGNGELTTLPAMLELLLDDDLWD